MFVFEIIIKALIDPLSLSCIALLFSVIIYKKTKRIRTAKYLLMFSGIWVTTWSQPYIVDLLLYPLEYHFPNKIISQSSPKKTDATHIHVLACYYDARKIRPFISRWAECSHQRMIEAVRLHNQFKVPIVITGGGFPEHADAPYASFAQEYLLSLGVDMNEIISLAKGTNTKTEITNLVSNIQPQNIFVVSSATHIFRINELYAEQNVHVYYAPVDHLSSGSLSPYITLPKSNSLESARRAFYEYLAIIKNSLSA